MNIISTLDNHLQEVPLYEKYSIIYQLMKWLGPFSKYTTLPSNKEKISDFITANSKINYRLLYNYQVNLCNYNTITFYKFNKLKYINIMIEESTARIITIVKKKDLNKWKKIL